MIKNFFLKLREPYPPNTDLKHTIPYIIALGLLIYLFLIIFQPFGLGQYNNPKKHLQLLGLGLTVIAWLSLAVVLFPRLFPAQFSEDAWSLGKEILWNIWLCLSTILSTTLYWSFVTGQELSIYVLYRITLNSLVFTVLFSPVGVLCVMSNYIRSLKRKLKKAEELNRGLEASPAKTSTQSLELISENGKERIRIRAEKLLYIQSCDNYANVIIQKNGKVEEKLIRSSLKNLEHQITLPYVMRCHRSFIVNLMRTQSIDGNSRNYTLTLKDCNQPIPVSRENEKQVLKALANLTQ